MPHKLIEFKVLSGFARCIAASLHRCIAACSVARSCNLVKLFSIKKQVIFSFVLFMLTAAWGCFLHAADGSTLPRYAAPSSSSANLDSGSGELERRDWALPVREMTFCDGYTFGAGFYTTMNLRINCGASDEAWRITNIAANRWNQLTKKPLIRVDRNTCASSVSRDDYRSTINFVNHLSQRDLGWAGYADIYLTGYRNGNQVRTTVNWTFQQNVGSWTTIEPEVEPQWMKAADIFILNDFRYYPEYKKIALVMHEMGHALGLRHQTASGNIMSYSEWAAVKDMLRPFITLALYANDYFVENFDTFTENDLLSSITGDANFGRVVSNNIQPQAQDKTALQCIYDFQHWGR